MSDGVAETGEVSFDVRVRKDHRIVIPGVTRERLGIREGDMVSVRLRKVALLPDVELVPAGPP